MRAITGCRERGQFGSVGTWASVSRARGVRGRRCLVLFFARVTAQRKTVFKKKKTQKNQFSKNSFRKKTAFDTTTKNYPLSSHAACVVLRASDRTSRSLPESSSFTASILFSHPARFFTETCVHLTIPTRTCVVHSNGANSYRHRRRPHREEPRRRSRLWSRAVVALLEESRGRAQLAPELRARASMMEIGGDASLCAAQSRISRAQRQIIFRKTHRVRG